MKKLVAITMVWALLANGMAADCNAIGVQDPSRDGVIPATPIGSDSFETPSNRTPLPVGLKNSVSAGPQR